jgi:thiosulfate reductase cytochrome b subunit
MTNLALASRPVLVHPLPARLFHWINAVGMIVMIGSGLEIYNASPLLPFRFAEWITLGGWLGGALLWHFAAMWLIAVNFLLWASYGIIGGRFRRKLMPIGPRMVIADLAAALRGRLVHGDLTHYNAVQKLLFLGALALIVLAIVSGLAIWKPVQLSWLIAIMGGFQGGRIIHFIAMSGLVLFLVVHVAMALLVPRTIRAMISGR